MSKYFKKIYKMLEIVLDTPNPNKIFRSYKNICKRLEKSI